MTVDKLYAFAFYCILSRHKFPISKFLSCRSADTVDPLI